MSGVDISKELYKSLTAFFQLLIFSIKGSKESNLSHLFEVM